MYLGGKTDEDYTTYLHSLCQCEFPLRKTPPTLSAVNCGRYLSFCASFAYLLKTVHTRVFCTSHMTLTDGSTFASSIGCWGSDKQRQDRLHTLDSENDAHEGAFRATVLRRHFDAHELICVCYSDVIGNGSTLHSHPVGRVGG